MALNPEFKTKWLELLRSGEYEQTASSLFNGEGYCCLGIACLAYGGKFHERMITEYQIPSSEKIPNMKKSDSDEYLSDIFLNEIGLRDQEQKELAEMNDAGNKFQDIADYIERNL